MKKMKKSSIKAITAYVLSVVFSIAMVVALFVTNMYADLISNVLDADTTKIINPVEDIYVSDFDSYEDLVKYEEELCQTIEEEGIVLLKNENETLPLQKDVKKISIFGQDSVDFVYGGSGSGSVDASKAVSMKTAFEKSGYEINQTLWDFYESGEGKQYRKTYPSETGEGEFAVNEVPVSKYTKEVKESFKTYSDAAIVVLGRSGGESSDIPTTELKSGRKYLQIDPNEEDTLKMVCDNFDTVIVMINANNAMELGFLEEYDVDACLWVGAVGQTGMYAIGEVLNGEVNPSGRLVDTYAYDSTSAPSFANIGDYSLENSILSDEDKNNKYLVYGENIYIGYRYYETRYEDTVLGAESVGEYQYAETVQFPFGYGLSYTDFSYENFEVAEEGDKFVVSVDVKNTGKTAGKEVVQIYMQSPYTDYDRENGVEKASVELAGFAKTKKLEPEETETVSIEIPKESLKAYDANGTGTYIVDAGDYYFAQGKDAHDALNNILAAKGFSTANGMTEEGNAQLTYKYQVASMDATTFSVSQETGNKIENAFSNADIRFYDETYTYLTRSDWVGTWPTTYMDGTWSITDSMAQDLQFNRSDEVIQDGSQMPVTESNGVETIYVSDLIGVDYDDPKWDTLLNQLSLEKMIKLVRMGGYATISIDAIYLPATTDKDGPSGFSSSIVPGRSGMAYPVEVVLASTWNVDLAEAFGTAIGEDSLALGITGWYAPGANTHRSPYSGRNFEYYSEDGHLAGKMCAYEVNGCRSKGCMVYVKHFALNDQETNRYGAAIFANEQAIREIFLKAFEYSVREGNTTALMASMNRVGATWSGANRGLMTQTLREEWGFNGMVITDQASVASMSYQDMISGLYAGTNLWLNTNSNLWPMDEYKSNPTVMQNVREAAHGIIYAVANSNAMNGISPESKVVTIMPWWQKTLCCASILVWLASIIVIIVTTRKLIKNRKPAVEIIEEDK